MSEELEVVSNAPARIVGGIPYLAEYMQLAGAISKTAMVPSSLRNKPDEVLAVVMYGAELGIGPMQALQQINFIGGKPSAAAELLRALVMEAGHQFILSASRDKAVAKCKRKDWDEFQETTFTMDDAKLAGLGSGDGWKKYPDQMLSARVTSKACRMWFADVIAGMSYTPEEVQEFGPSTPTPQAARTPRTHATGTGTMTRSAPTLETGELVTAEDATRLSTALGMLNDEEKETIKPLWQAQNFPKKIGEMTAAQCETALGIVHDILNAVTAPEEDERPFEDEGNIVEAEVVESRPVEVSRPKPGDEISNAQIGKIRIMLGNLGVTGDVHGYVSELLGRTVTSLKDLSKKDASNVIDVLTARSA